MCSRLLASIFVLGWVSDAAAQLVSREQVQEAKTKAILWTLFAVIMLGVCIFQIVRFFKRKNRNADQDKK
jgi:hypothetical protein